MTVELSLRYKQVLPVTYACASAATSSDGVSWCILEAWEDGAAVVLENLIAVRISTAPKHRWQPVSEITIGTMVDDS